jgi:hypothetical protein
MDTDEHRLGKARTPHEDTKLLRKFKLCPSCVFVPLWFLIRVYLRVSAVNFTFRMIQPKYLMPTRKLLSVEVESAQASSIDIRACDSARATKLGARW